MCKCLRLILALGLVAATSTFGIAQQSQAGSANSQPDVNACRQSVQQFYDWYLRRAKANKNEDLLDVALKNKASLFDPILKQKLEEDERASAKSPGEIVGLDFDPFLNAQDNPDHLVVGKATMKGGNCLVEVHRFFNGEKQNKTPDVMPELALKNGQWTFVNFHYPASDTPSNDLLSVLKGLAADRKKYPVH